MTEPQLTIEQQKIEIAQLKGKVLRNRAVSILMLFATSVMAYQSAKAYDSLQKEKQITQGIIVMYNKKNHELNSCNSDCAKLMLDKQYMQDGMQEALHKGFIQKTPPPLVKG